MITDTVAKHFEDDLSLIRANGTPSHDTFRRVFSLLDPAQLEKATVSFLMENITVPKQSLPADEGEDYRLICVDGKEEKGTGRK